MQPDRARPGPLPGGPYFLLAMAAILVFSAFLLPEELVLSLARLFDTPAAQTDSFDDIVAQVDDALKKGEPLPVTRSGFDAHHRLVAARRLAAAGKATGEEVRRAAAMFGDFQDRIDSEQTEGSKDAMRSLRNETLDEALPRVERAAVDETLATLRSQIEEATFLADAEPVPEVQADAGAPDESDVEPVVEPGADAACSTCHLELVDLPDGARLDLPHLWPSLSDEVLTDPTKLPNMMSAAEAGDCLECHQPHDAPGFGVSDELRADNVGLWLHVHEYEGLIRVQAKVQNIDATHRIPAGRFPRAYALVVTAKQGDDQLARWWGPVLPEHLRELGESGLFLGRTAVDANGEFTTRMDDVRTVSSDTRLEPGRFYDEYFLFKAPESGEVTVEATVRYLPDAANSDGRDIQRATRKLVVGSSIR